MPAESQEERIIGGKRRTADVKVLEDVDFSGLTFHPQVLDGLRKSGFEKPSPIQLRAIPLGRCGLDLIVQAKSGTGKTCVFTIIALESLDMSSKSLQVLILAPTREIAVQIQHVIMSVGRSLTGLKCHVFIGGTPLGADKQKLARCHVAVGTPGRIKQLIENQIMKADSVRLLVLDEADKLLEEGFQEQINWIYSTLPENKQMIAASATYPEALADHVTAYMHNPTMVRLNAADPSLLGIKQFRQLVSFQPSVHLAYKVKVDHLLVFLSRVSFHQCLVFSNLQTRAENLSHLLCARGWPSTFIAGCQDQTRRLTAINELRASQCRILIATDLISRGIDVDKVNLVINLDVPRDYDTYLHRIGRAGRFGSHGLALTYIATEEDFEAFQNLSARARMPILDLPELIPMDFIDRAAEGSSNDAAASLNTAPVETVEMFELRTDIRSGDASIGVASTLKEPQSGCTLMATSGRVEIPKPGDRDSAAAAVRDAIEAVRLAEARCSGEGGAQPQDGSHRTLPEGTCSAHHSFCIDVASDDHYASLCKAIKSYLSITNNYGDGISHQRSTKTENVDRSHYTSGNTVVCDMTSVSEKMEQLDMHCQPSTDGLASDAQTGRPHSLSGAAAAAQHFSTAGGQGARAVLTSGDKKSQWSNLTARSDAVRRQAEQQTKNTGELGTGHRHVALQKEEVLKQPETPAAGARCTTLSAQHCKRGVADSGSERGAMAQWTSLGGEGSLAMPLDTAAADEDAEEAEPVPDLHPERGDVSDEVITRSPARCDLEERIKTSNIYSSIVASTNKTRFPLRHRNDLLWHYTSFAAMDMYIRQMTTLPRINK